MEQRKTVSIRAFESNDLPAITDIRIASFSNSDSIIVRLGRDATYRFMEWITSDSAKTITLCAEWDDKIVGYGIVAHQRVDTRAFVRRNFGFLMKELASSPQLLTRFFFHTRMLKVLIGHLNRFADPGTESRTIEGGYRKICRMLDTAVHPDYQGKGIGTSLLHAREKEASKRGFTHAGCTVRRNNPRGVRWHEHYGYQVVSIGRNSISMEKALQNSPNNDLWNS